MRELVRRLPPARRQARQRKPPQADALASGFESKLRLGARRATGQAGQAGKRPPLALRASRAASMPAGSWQKFRGSRSPAGQAGQAGKRVRGTHKIGAARASGKLGKRARVGSWHTCMLGRGLQTRAIHPCSTPLHRHTLTPSRPFRSASGPNLFATNPLARLPSLRPASGSKILPRTYHEPACPACPMGEWPQTFCHEPACLRARLARAHAASKSFLFCF